LNERVGQTISDHKRLEVDIGKGVLVSSQRGNSELALVIVVNLFTNSRDIVTSI
jgi:hypothetical protein